MLPTPNTVVPTPHYALVYYGRLQDAVCLCFAVDPATGEFVDAYATCNPGGYVTLAPGR